MIPQQDHRKQGQHPTKLGIVVKVKAAQSRLVLVKGKSLKVAAAAFTADGASKSKVTYKSSNKRVAKVSRVGKIKALKVGQAKITLRAANGAKTVIKVTVVAKKSMAKIKQVKVTGVAKRQTVGQVSWAKATWKSAKRTGAKVRFSTTNRAIIVIDKTGRIQAVAPGQASIKVKVGNKTKTIKVTVS